LYDILEIKAVLTDKSPTFKEDLETAMSERNQSIREGLKKWEKKYLLFKYCRKERRAATEMIS
jgi:hypothetical protein